MPKLFSVDRLLSFKPAPFGVLFQYVNFACAIPLNCDAKVVLLFVSCKQIGEKVCFLNFPLLKRLFIHIF